MSKQFEAKRKGENGTLLLEVLIAATVLSIGILACLNVFSSAVYTSTRMTEQATLQFLMDQVFFDWFLDPTEVDLETGVRTLPQEKKIPFRLKLKTQSMTSETQSVEVDEQGRPITDPTKKNPPKPSSPVAFTVDEQGRPVYPTPTGVPSLKLKDPNIEFFDTTFVAERSDGKVSYEFKEFLFRYGQKKKTQ